MDFNTISLDGPFRQVASVWSVVVGQDSILLHTINAHLRIPQEFNESTFVETFISSKLSEMLSSKANTAFISGDGVDKPRGITTYPAGTNWWQIEQVNSGGASTVTSDGILNLFYALKEEYSSRATFLMRRDTLRALRFLKNPTTDQYMWQPRLTAGAPDTLMGVPIIEVGDMPALTSNALAIALGDFSAGYRILDRAGVRVFSKPSETLNKTMLIDFSAFKTIGGDVVDFEAIKLMKIAA